MRSGCLYKKENSKLKYVPSIGDRRGVVKHIHYLIAHARLKRTL